ncbi:MULTISPECIES: hypothetical protein [unclassified Acinetobacter]|uniref:hypothetical protein n=1 Tax=unclassified Acinetobacter TaxID=196816 RepID=UPI00044E6788|nr:MULTISPECIES: hypothetical protein [unclassified Acinetobacter]EZQ11915.1 hypothetical protein CL42_03495 [Acinetobacter sp. Ver3]
MPTIISNIANKFRKVYQKAEGFIEEEREFPVSQVFLNATFKRFVTDNVSILEDLHADLHDDWLRLYATLKVKGLYTILSVDLKLIQMELNKDVQLIVFEQISETEVIEAKFQTFWMKIAFRSALFFYQKILRKDPLGMILERFNVIKVKDDLLHLDLNQWLGKNRSIIETLGKVHVNHAELRETELVVIGNVNLMALFSKMNTDRFKSKSDEVESDHITPIKQKDD